MISWIQYVVASLKKINPAWQSLPFCWDVLSIHIQHNYCYGWIYIFHFAIFFSCLLSSFASLFYFLLCQIDDFHHNSSFAGVFKNQLWVCLFYFFLVVALGSAIYFLAQPHSDNTNLIKIQTLYFNIAPFAPPPLFCYCHICVCVIRWTSHL